VNRSFCGGKNRGLTLLTIAIPYSSHHMLDDSPSHYSVANVRLLRLQQGETR
jgi:hypothetical protein